MSLNLTAFDILLSYNDKDSIQQTQKFIYIPLQIRYNKDIYCMCLQEDSS